MGAPYCLRRFKLRIFSSINRQFCLGAPFVGHPLLSRTCRMPATKPLSETWILALCTRVIRVPLHSDIHRIFGGTFAIYLPVDQSFMPVHLVHHRLRKRLSGYFEEVWNTNNSEMSQSLVSLPSISEFSPILLMLLLSWSRTVFSWQWREDTM